MSIWFYPDDGGPPTFVHDPLKFDSGGIRGKLGPSPTQMRTPLEEWTQWSGSHFYRYGFWIQCTAIVTPEGKSWKIVYQDTSGDADRVEYAYGSLSEIKAKVEEKIRG